MKDPLTYPRPAESEHAPYYAKYIELVPDGNIVELLAGHMHRAVAEYAKVSEEQSLFSYAPGKWTIREMLLHVIDAERIFAYRALRIARNDKTPLASFDQDSFVPESGANGRSWPSLLEEYSQVREATLALFRGLPPIAWVRSGTASEKTVSVRALAYIIAGHELHHLEGLRRDYKIA